MISIFTWYFLSLTGRISRNEFWLGCMGLLAVCGLFTRLLLDIAFHNQAGRIWDRHELSLALSMPSLIAVAVLVWPVIAIFVKRLHDLNISGWWLLTAAAIPFVSQLANANSSTLLAFAISVLSFVRGNPGNNRFGRDPLPRTAV
jgi:uncharacterized membrane protein YhaH (DUF805 family)